MKLDKTNISMEKLIVANLLVVTAYFSEAEAISLVEGKTIHKGDCSYQLDNKYNLSEFTREEPLTEIGCFAPALYF